MASMTPDQVANLLQQHGSNIPQDEYDESVESPEARQNRTALLGTVLTTCQSVWFSNSEDIDVLAEKLGDGSRDAAWRVPFGDSGILDFFLGVIAIDGLRPGLQLHSLRLIGNSCADTDENRARIVQGNHFPALYRRLQDESLIPFTIPVLYNILVDYEPAQLLASQTHLNQHLITHLSSPNLTNYSPFVTYFCKILGLLASQEGEGLMANPQTVQVLTSLALNPAFSYDVDDFTSLASIAVAYLSMENFKAAAVSSQPDLQVFLNLVYHAYTAFDLKQIEDEDSATALKKLRAALLTTLADLSSSDAFAASHPFKAAFLSVLLGWLQAPNQHLQAAACIALGNLSRSDEASIALVHTHRAHQEPIKIVSNPETDDPQVLHSALSFLKNLAIHAQNKPVLGDLLAPGCVSRIYHMDTLPQVQFAAISLTRLLLVNCPANVSRVCSRLSKDQSSPSYDRTTVHSIVSLFQRSDAEPTKLEAARSLAALCRVLHSNPVQQILPEWDPVDAEDFGNDGKRRHMFYETIALGEPLSFLICQDKWPILRSEAWFVFALMCRSKDGSGVAISAMWSDTATKAIIEAIKGKPLDPDAIVAPSPQSSDMSPASFGLGVGGLELEPQQVDPQQQANMVKIDRENVVVMCSEILRNWTGELPQLRQSTYQDLVTEGTQLIVEDRAGVK